VKKIINQKDDYIDPHFIIIDFIEKLGGESLEAFELATLIYKGVKRLSKRPALDHFIEAFRVAAICRVLDHPEQVRIIVGIFCHDMPEEKRANLAFLAWKFSALYASDAGRLSKLGKTIDEYIADLLTEYVLTVIKLCDRAANLLDVDAFSTKKLEEYLNETREKYLPMIEKALGLYPEYKNVLLALRWEILQRLKANESILFQRKVEGK